MAKLRSIRFPFQQGVSTFPRQADDDDAIRSSVIQILTTSKNERVMRPSFGVDSLSHLFEADSDANRAGLEREVRSALSTWEPRISVDSVIVETNDITEPGQLLVSIFYTVLQTGRPDSVTIGGI